MEVGVWEPFDGLSRYPLQRLPLFKMFLNEKSLSLRQKEEQIFSQRGREPRTEECRPTALIYHYESLMNENIIHIFLWFYAWMWSISRDENERGKRRGWHCYSDSTNNCIYDGIIQYIYFPLIVPIKRWHFPSICSPLMFYVLLFSRVCVLLSKRANFSQCYQGREVGSLSFYYLIAIFVLFPTQAKCCSFSLRGNVTHTHMLLIAHVFRNSYPRPGFCAL